ncbi:GNAT family N-acetyltransferase, partial [Paenibacillus sp. Soil522]|uniref:GNAT family N-acetyltransferase n=1 Tax=Paenibacillus sp. Soil522 TaxID=1736388 RepID=UPI0012DEED5B
MCLSNILNLVRKRSGCSSIDQRLIGTCGYNGWETNRGSRVEIAYDLGKPYWRQGYMSEILESIIQFSYEIAGFNRIEALTNLDAAPSMNLLI